MDLSVLVEEAKSHFAEIGLAKYRIKFISSGFGDILTNSSFSAGLAELMGLEFEGIDFVESFSRPYYVELFERLNLGRRHAGDRNHPEVVIENIETGVEQLLKELLGITPPAPAAVCISPKYPISLAKLHDYTPVCERFFNNGFRDWFLETISPLPWRQESRGMTLTVHLRLGDVAAVRLGNHVAIPVFVRRPQTHVGLAHVSEIQKNAVVHRESKVVDQCIAAVRELKSRHPNLTINLVSDGFDRAKFLLMLPDTRSKLSGLGVNYSEHDIDAHAEAVSRKIHASGLFDRIHMGESNSDELLHTISTVLNSDIVVSTARSFIFNILAFFPSQRPGIKFYSPLSKGIHGQLQNVGIRQYQFRNFPEFATEFNLE